MSESLSLNTKDKLSDKNTFDKNINWHCLNLFKTAFVANSDEFANKSDKPK